MSIRKTKTFFGDIMSGTMSTREMAKMINVKPGRILTAIWAGRLETPERDSGNRYIWRMEDAARLAAFFSPKPKKGV